MHTRRKRNALMHTNYSLFILEYFLSERIRLNPIIHLVINLFDAFLIVWHKNGCKANILAICLLLRGVMVN